ncbi:MAG: DUF692 domain-containing protein [Myxococcota bacterium]
MGLGWRRETAWMLHERAGIGAELGGLEFSEIIAESVDPRRPLAPALAHLVARGVPVIPHGVTLSLGGAERPDPARLDHLARVAELLGAPVISEHVAFVRGGGIEIGHLAPVPRTWAMLDILSENITIAQRALPVPLVVENIAALFDWPGAEMSEAEFLSELVERTGVGLLLDVANLHGNAHNLGGDVPTFLDHLPMDRVVYAHVAGGFVRDGVYHDTHAHPVGDGVLSVLAQALARRPDLPVLLERDRDFDGADALAAELASIAQVMAEAGPDGEVAHAA